MMKNRPKEPSALKYSVLKPNQLVTSLKGRFRPPETGCGFEVAQEGGIGIRRYRATLESLERFVQACQWRMDQSGPIVRCLYLDLLTPRPSSSQISVQVYVEHLELPLSKMQGLISPEAFYLVQQSLEGFRVLWEKTGAVGLTDEAMGLDCEGDCRVWLNRSLSLNYPQDPPCSKPWEIAQEVVRIVQGRSEPAAHALLARLIEKIGSKQFDFKGVEAVLANFVKQCQLKIPGNLKYLVYQHRLRIKVQTLSSASESKQIIRPARIPSFLPRRESVYTQKFFTGRFQGRKAPQRHMSALQAGTHSPSHRISHYPSVYSSPRPDDLNASLMETSKKLRLSNGLQISVSIRSKESPSRCKSRSFEFIGLMNSLTPKNSSNYDQNSSKYQEIMRSKRQSNYSDNSRTKVSIMSRSKHSNCSLCDHATAKRLTSKCSYVETPSHQLEDLNSQTESESGEYSSKILQEPTTPKLLFKELKIETEGPTFHLIPEAERIITANNWTATLRNLGEHETRLNTSIVEGQDTSIYLADVRLQKLQGLGGGLTASMSSRGSEVR